MRRFKSMPLANKTQQGFTLIELVVVIVILSSLSIYAASRYSSSSGFSIYAAQTQAIAIIRQIQLARMQGADTGSGSSDDRLLVSQHCLGSVLICQENSSDLASSRRLVLPQQHYFFPSITVDFDLLGAPIAGPVKINISGEAQKNHQQADDALLAVCINSQGYVYGC
jgi:MSHA pilin protein MshC